MNRFSRKYIIHFISLTITLGSFCTSSYLYGQGVAYASEKSEKIAQIDSLALEKIRDLSKYISIIGDKTTPFSEADLVVERALELFAEGAKIGVSNIVVNEVQYFELREYFERLMALNYDRVNIEWYDMQYISDIERMPNGVYVGVVTIYQRFQGMKGDQIVYRDVTKKDITVYVEKKQTQIEGDMINFWDVVLGDIMVAETKLN
jgi:hypothetical protein